MAVDTRDKRASIFGLYLAYEALPLADGSVNQADRQQTGYTYPGIAASALALGAVASNAFTFKIYTNEFDFKTYSNKATFT